MKNDPANLINRKSSLDLNILPRWLLQTGILLVCCNFAFADEGLLNGESTSPVHVLPRAEIVHEQVDAHSPVGSKQLKNASSVTPVQALQAAVRAAFGSRSGALVALDPNNGKVIALVSITNKPGTKSSKKAINLALAGNYNPGATIKPFLALAALEMGFRTAEDEFSDNKGFVQYGEYWYVDGYKSSHGHGRVNLHRSIVQSCDTYYYALAEEMGIDAIHGFLTHFGFGKKSDMACESVSAGILATPAWKDARFKQQWFTGDTIATGIGQGYFLATPLQMASAVAMLANGGTLYQPSLARTDKDAKVSADSVSDVAAKFPLTAANLATIRNAMIAATRQGAGSRSFADATYLVAGKTGSMPRSAMRKDGSFESLKDHSLFIGYAPANQPTIALAVVVEEGGFGYQSAAPVARAVFDYVLRNEEILAPVPEFPVLEDSRVSD